MAVITQQFTATTGATLTAAIWNDEFSNIIDDYNGNITNANIAAGAAIATSKIAGTAATVTGSETLTNKTLTKPTINGSVSAFTTDTDGATVTFSMAESNLHTVVLGGNRTLAVSNTSTGQPFVIRLKQDGTGSRTVTWFSTINWANDTAPTLSTAANNVDVFGFITTASGTYDGFIIGQGLDET